MSNSKNFQNPFSTEPTNNFSEEELEIIVNNNFNQHNNQAESQGQILDQIDAVFENKKHQSRSEMNLQLKVNQLQKICSQLYKDNKRLSGIIQQFLDEYEQKNSKSFSADEFSQINLQISQIQKLIHQYREGLQSYQRKIAKQLKQKDLQIKQCTIKLQNRKLQNEQLMNDHRNAQKVIRGLKKDFDEIKKQSKNDTQAKNQSKNKNDVKYESLNSDQQQFVDMVEEFWSEVEKQASIKKGIQSEMEKLKAQVSQLNKQLANKNQQIIQLQQQLDKYERQTCFSFSRKIHRKQKISTQKMKSYSLLDLISKKIMLQIDQLFQLIQKTLEFYEQKFEKQHYTELFPQNILIFDYHSETMRIFSVRQATNQTKIKQKKTKNRLISNMTTILLALINLCQSSGVYFSQQQSTKQKLRQLINMAMKSLKNGQTIDQFELMAHLITSISNYNQDANKNENEINC